MASKITTLQDEADKAYFAQDKGWFESLPTEDLTALWGVACSTEGGSWDDEVFDALDRRGWFERAVTRAPEKGKVRP